MNYLIEQDRYIPISELTTNSSSLLNVYEYPLIGWVGYIEAGSFTSFLLDEYGKEKYMKIYDQPNLNNVIEEIYGKSVEELEKEWLAFIDQEKHRLEDQSLFRKPYYKKLWSELLKLDFEAEVNRYSGN